MQHVAEQGGKWQNRGQMAKQEGKWQKWHNRRTSSVCSTWQNRGASGITRGKWQNRRASGRSGITGGQVAYVAHGRTGGGKWERINSVFLAIIKNSNQNIEAKVFSHIHNGANIPFVVLYLLDALKICTLRQSLEDTKLVEAKENEEPMSIFL